MIPDIHSLNHIFVYDPTFQLYFQTATWNPEQPMIEKRHYAAAAMFEDYDDIWWITGGKEDFDWTYSTEFYNANDSSFTLGPDLPRELILHNLVNVNKTHMVLLGGNDASDRINIFDR